MGRETYLWRSPVNLWAKAGCLPARVVLKLLLHSQAVEEVPGSKKSHTELYWKKEYYIISEKTRKRCCGELELKYPGYWTEKKKITTRIPGADSGPAAKEKDSGSSRRRTCRGVEPPQVIINQRRKPVSCIKEAERTTEQQETYLRSCVRKLDQLVRNKAEVITIAEVGCELHN